MTGKWAVQGCERTATRFRPLAHARTERGLKAEHVHVLHVRLVHLKQRKRVHGHDKAANGQPADSRRCDARYRGTSCN